MFPDTQQDVRVEEGYFRGPGLDGVVTVLGRGASTKGISWEVYSTYNVEDLISTDILVLGSLCNDCKGYLH